MKRVVLLTLALMLTIGIVAVQAQGGLQARAELKDANGQTVGTANFVEGTGSVEINVQVNNLPPGEHGLHLHAVGQCDAPEFQTAGGHFNPAGQQHGLDNPAGPHAGDLPNLVVGENGQGQSTYANNRITLSAGPNSLFDADGSAVVIHAGPDDNASDPAGNSGTRIACGVITIVSPAVLPVTGVASLPAVWLVIATGILLLAGGFFLRRPPGELRNGE